jgi:hypothetical protein
VGGDLRALEIREGVLEELGDTLEQRLAIAGAIDAVAFIVGGQQLSRRQTTRSEGCPSMSSLWGGNDGFSWPGGGPFRISILGMHRVSNLPSDSKSIVTTAR